MTIIVIPRAFMVACGFTEVRPAKQYFSGYLERDNSIPKDYLLKISRKAGTIKVVAATVATKRYVDIFEQASSRLAGSAYNGLVRWILKESKKGV